jgi:hypothetical protein
MRHTNRSAALAACTAIACLAAPAFAAPRPPRLGDQLRAMAPSPVALVQTDNGDVVARTLDGSQHQALVTGVAQGEVAYDPARELLWYRAADKLWVLDLRAQGSTPVAIVDHMAQPGFAIQIAGDHLETVGAQAVVLVRWDRAPKLGDTGPRHDLVGEEDDEIKAIAGARLVGKAWLARNRDRARRTLVVRPFDGAAHVLDGQLADGGDRGTDCRDELCHRQIVLGATGLALLVATDYRDHDGHLTECYLVTLSVHHVAQPKQRSCHGELDAAGDAFAARGDDQLWDAAGPHPLGGQLIGFLDPGLIIPPPAD